MGVVGHYDIRQSLAEGEYAMLKRLALQQGRWPPPERFDAEAELSKAWALYERRREAFVQAVKRTGKIPVTDAKQR